MKKIAKIFIVVTLVIFGLTACGPPSAIKPTYNNYFVKPKNITPPLIYPGNTPGLEELPCSKLGVMCRVTPENERLLSEIRARMAAEEEEAQENDYADDSINISAIHPEPQKAENTPPATSSFDAKIKTEINKLKRTVSAHSAMFRKIDERLSKLVILSSNGKPNIMRVLGYKPGSFQTSQKNVKFVISQLKQLKQAYPGKQISIDLYGSADKSGNPQKNQKIADKRAKWFAKQITNANIGVTINNVVGLGSTEASIYNGKNRCVYVVPSAQ